HTDRVDDVDERGQVEELVDAPLESGLFAQLAHDCISRRLAPIDSAARKTPMPGGARCFGQTHEQDRPIYRTNGIGSHARPSFDHPLRPYQLGSRTSRTEPTPSIAPHFRQCTEPRNAIERATLVSARCPETTHWRVLAGDRRQK